MNPSTDKHAPDAPDAGLWDANAVAAYLKVSRSWVYQKAEAGLLPVLRMPGSSLLRFEPDKIRAYARGEWSPAKVLPLPDRRGMLPLTHRGRDG